jgi:hypothetical protein
LFQVNLGGVKVLPKKKSRCPQPKLLAAQSLFLQTAEAFRKMAACLRQEQAANLYSDKQSAVDAYRSAHDLFQLISLPLRAAKSVFTNLIFLAEHGANRSFFRWLSSTAGYVPGNEAQLSLSDLLTTSGSSLVVATRFYPGAQKTFRSSWQAFRLQLRASLATANRSAFALSQSLTTPFAVPSLVSKTVIFVTGAFIPKTNFKINFLCVLFFRLMIFRVGKGH